jgi:hypothetical protein
MAEPFRDEMSAALTRAEKLAEENQDLREELQRLRETAHSVRSAEPDHALANQTLAVLDRLEAATHVDAAPIVKKDERADMSQLADLPKKPHAGREVPNVLPPPALPPPLRRTGVRALTLVIACFVCLFVGIMLGAMIR